MSEVKNEGLEVGGVRAIVTDAFVSMIEAALGMKAPDCAPPAFIQSAIDRAIDRINSEALSGYAVRDARIAELELSAKRIYSEMLEANNSFARMFRAGAINLTEERDQLRAELAALNAKLDASKFCANVADDLRAELAAAKETISRYEVTAENCDVLRAELANQLEVKAFWIGRTRALEVELAEIKTQDTVAFCDERTLGVLIGGKAFSVGVEPALSAGPSSTVALYAAPVSEAKAQGEYGDAYQGAREDLAIWKQRALKAEEKVRQQEQIIDHLTSEAQGESRFGEPVITAGEPCVPDGYVLADKKSLGMVLQALVNAPHHIRELQATRQPIELFSDNPINVLIANYETPAAPAAPAADAGLVDMYSHLQKVTPYRFKKIQDAAVTDGGDVLYFHKDRFDAALLADMAAHCAAKGVV